MILSFRGSTSSIFFVVADLMLEFLNEKLCSGLSLAFDSCYAGCNRVVIVGDGWVAIIWLQLYVVLFLLL